jgi:hypothetical protein
MNMIIMLGGPSGTGKRLYYNNSLISSFLGTRLGIT